MMGLWTPTDWNAEAAILKEYIRWLVRNRAYCTPISINFPRIPYTEILRIFMQTGVLYVNSLESETPATQEMTYEYWLENIR